MGWWEAGELHAISKRTGSAKVRIGFEYGTDLACTIGVPCLIPISLKGENHPHPCQGALCGRTY